MDYLLNNPFPKWIVSYIISYMIYFMSRQQLGAYFPAKKGRFKSNMAPSIEIISNTRGGIAGKIGERVVWGTNLSPGCSLIRDVPDKKVVFRQIFLLFKLFFAVKY